MSPEALYWSWMILYEFETMRGIRSNGEALFESSDNFSGYRYDN
jgi:hypothetical protein